MINVHSVLPRSEINGPGARMVVFFQGCTRGCPGCFNPKTHSQKPNKMMTVADIFSGYIKEQRTGTGAAAGGLTVSGGEPFEQMEGLYQLLKTAKTEFGLSTVVYTGYLKDELLGMEGTERIFSYIDVLIDGPYDKDNKEQTLLARGSVGQSFNMLSGKYKEEDFLVKGRVEIIIGKDGNVTKTGFGCVD